MAIQSTCSGSHTVTTSSGLGSGVPTTTSRICAAAPAVASRICAAAPAVDRITKKLSKMVIGPSLCSHETSQSTVAGQDLASSVQESGGATDQYSILHKKV